MVTVENTEYKNLKCKIGKEESKNSLTIPFLSGPKIETKVTNATTTPKTNVTIEFKCSGYLIPVAPLDVTFFLNGTEVGTYVGKTFTKKDDVKGLKIDAVKDSNNTITIVQDTPIDLNYKCKLYNKDKSIDETAQEDAKKTDNKKNGIESLGAHLLLVIFVTLTTGFVNFFN